MKTAGIERKILLLFTSAFQVSLQLSKDNTFFSSSAFIQIQGKPCCPTLPTANSTVTLAPPTDFFKQMQKIGNKNKYRVWIQ